MNDALRLSPIYDSLQQLGGIWHDIKGMKSLYSLPDDQANAARLGIANLSFIPRFGVKGAIASSWLATQSIPVPDRPNSWCQLPEGGIIARLGISEFLIEDSNVAPKLIQACKSPPAKVYPVLRQDLASHLLVQR